MFVNKSIKRAYKSKFLYVNDNLTSYTNSGIRATVYGASGFIGSSICSRLGMIGSDVIMPTRFNKYYNDNIKMLRSDTNLSMGYVMFNMNFNDPNAVTRSIAKSNVVINLIGPSRKKKNLADFEEANISVPQKLAREARRKGVKKFIHFSSVGADPKSSSLDLRTKYHGELAVRDEFPEAIIMRPSTVIGFDDYFQRLVRKQAEYTFHFLCVYGNLNALRQPIIDDDVAEAVMNAIKMNEANGNVYELGGPFLYTRRELYEILINIFKRPMDLIKIKPSIALGITRYINSIYFNHEDFLKDDLDLIVKKENGVKTIADLYVKPVSVVSKMEHINFNYATKFNLTLEEKQLLK